MEEENDFEQLLSSIKNFDLYDEERLELVRALFPHGTIETDRPDGPGQVVVYTGLFRDVLERARPLRDED